MSGESVTNAGAGQATRIKSNLGRYANIKDATRRESSSRHENTYRRCVYEFAVLRINYKNGESLRLYMHVFVLQEDSMPLRTPSWRDSWLICWILSHALLGSGEATRDDFTTYALSLGLKEVKQADRWAPTTAHIGTWSILWPRVLQGVWWEMAIETTDWGCCERTLADRGWAGERYGHERKKRLRKCTPRPSSPVFENGQREGMRL